MDAQVARREDPRLRELMERFVCVRAVRMKGKELAIFQFDWDQSWSVMFLNGDRTIYGRYGTRTGKGDATEERISVRGLAAAAAGALELHAAYPGNRASLAAKTGPTWSGRDVEDLPYFRGKVQDTPRSCIHCHQVWEGVRDEWRAAKKPLTDEQLYVWPVPDLVGLDFDVNERATLKAVAPGSAAEKAGFRKGDRVASMEGQPVVSPADVQWVLHRAKAPGNVDAEVLRGDERLKLVLPLAKDWRRGSDLSWRRSSIILRPKFRVDDGTDADRAKAGIAASAMALVVRNANPQSDAARKGMRPGDVIVQVDDHADRWSETEFLAYLNQRRDRGDKVVIQVLEGRKRRKIEIKAP